MQKRGNYLESKRAHKQKQKIKHSAESCRSWQQKKRPFHPKIQILRTVKFSVEQISWTVFITISHAFKHICSRSSLFCCWVLFIYLHLLLG